MRTKTHHEHEEIITAAGRDFRCLFRREVDRGYGVTCADLPPMLAFGETLNEARDNARERIEAWIDEIDRRAHHALIEQQQWLDQVALKTPRISGLASLR
jgi:predicted RNase H-like HicB family nuclease